jgi:secondary thiamine-phosphate synthase enzyme
MWIQKEFHRKPRMRGFHLITDEVIRQLPELTTINIGLLNILIKHTSAALTINENADPTVRKDFEIFLARWSRKINITCTTMKAATTCPRI